MEDTKLMELSVDREQDAWSFLTEPGLTRRVIDDITVLGVAGEDRNKLLVYLVATSRKMESPLACIVRGDSCTGKSYLVEAVVKLIPPEDRKILSRVTKQELFYEVNLEHKFIYIREAAGSAEASYAIRTLLSEKELKLKRAVGLVVQELIVHGPVAYVETTAEGTVETQKANRVFEIWMDESEEHTLEIHRIQREQYTPEGLQRKQLCHDIIDRHHIAQRLIKPVPVIIPYAMQMDFPSRLVRNRRDHQRFLDLIGASAFLHQLQRPRGQLDDEEYIEAALEDYETAYWLMQPVLAHALDEHGAKPRELLDGIHEMVEQRAEEERKSLWKVVFTRSEIADFLGWTKRQVRTHVKELEELEAIEIVRGSRGREYKYRLLHDPASGMGSSRLLTSEELHRKLQNRHQS